MSDMLVLTQNMKGGSVFTTLQHIDKIKFHVNFWHFGISVKDFLSHKIDTSFSFTLLLLLLSVSNYLKKKKKDGRNMISQRQFRIGNTIFKIILFSVLLIRFWTSWGQGLSENTYSIWRKVSLQQILTLLSLLWILIPNTMTNILLALKKYWLG